jgi:hypothetical protein
VIAIGEYPQVLFNFIDFREHVDYNARATVLETLSLAELQEKRIRIIENFVEIENLKARTYFIMEVSFVPTNVTLNMMKGSQRFAKASVHSSTNLKGIIQPPLSSKNNNSVRMSQRDALPTPIQVSIHTDGGPE